MSKKVFFKIIVPNYNNIPYIKKCLDSILNQTFQDFFIVVVDDLSTDMSDRFCEAYERKFPDKLKLLRLDKKGCAGAARNKALKWDCIESEYIWFVDSDDWLCDNQVLERMYSSIVNANMPEVLQCAWKQAGIQYVQSLNIDVSMTVKQGSAPWKYCIKSQFKNVLFDEDLPSANDVLWSIRLLDAVKNQTQPICKTPCIQYNTRSTTSCNYSGEAAAELNRQYSRKQLLEHILKDVTVHSSIALKAKNEKIDILKKDFAYIANAKSLSLDDVMNNAYAISIDDSRYSLMCKTFKYAGFKTLPKKFDGVKNKNLKPWQCCSLAHINLVNYAKDKKLPYVMVFEDDAYPCINCAEKLEKYLSVVPANAKTILYGWSNMPVKLTSLYNDITHKHVLTNGSHAYLLFENAYDEFIRLFYQNKALIPADNKHFKLLSKLHAPQQCLFIQYCKEPSMGGSCNYVATNGGKCLTKPPEGFFSVEDALDQK